MIKEKYSTIVRKKREEVFDGYSSLKTENYCKSKELGIDKIGFASAEPFTHLEESMRRSKELGHTTGFEHPVLRRAYLS